MLCGPRSRTGERREGADGLCDTDERRSLAQSGCRPWEGFEFCDLHGWARGILHDSRQPHTRLRRRRIGLTLEQSCSSRRGLLTRKKRGTSGPHEPCNSVGGFLRAGQGSGSSGDDAQSRSSPADRWARRLGQGCHAVARVWGRKGRAAPVWLAGPREMGRGRGARRWTTGAKHGGGEGVRLGRRVGAGLGRPRGGEGLWATLARWAGEKGAQVSLFSYFLSFLIKFIHGRESRIKWMHIQGKHQTNINVLSMMQQLLFS
jgi:hypothetical protein